MATPCSITGCTREAKVKGMCQAHYQKDLNRRKKSDAELLHAERKRQWESKTDIERMEYVRDEVIEELASLQDQIATKQRDLADVERTLKLMREYVAENPIPQQKSETKPTDSPAAA